jgi:hypothetical protein
LAGVYLQDELLSSIKLAASASFYYHHHHHHHYAVDHDYSDDYVNLLGENTSMHRQTLKLF